MAPKKHYYMQSRPFTGVNFQHKVAVTDPSFRYTPNVICSARLELVGLCLDLKNQQSSLVPKTVFTTFEYIDVLCSATLGCHLCSLFCSSARWDFRDTDYTLFASTVRYELLPSPRPSTLFGLRLCMEANGTDTVHVYPGNQDEVENWESPPAGFPQASLGRSTGDPETTALARAWLGKCLREHCGCSGTDEKTRTARPKRLLDLQGGIKLVDSCETNGAAYVTLSHCWGKAHLIRLLKSNEEKFRKGAITGLPKTFREAIQVTRDLGYRYIWIDSLCIIQDSTEDWKHQAKDMALFYTNSDFTIAALKSSGSREGCFTAERNPLGRRGLHSSELGISIWPASSHSMWKNEVDQIGFGASPLHSRAWVMQERYSSPRTLLYGKNGIYWECRSAQASETSYRQVELGDEANKKTWLRRLLQFGSGQEMEYDSKSWMKHWKGVLNTYTSCEMTYDTDKIIAVTGLVSLIEERSSPARRCILGLWDHDLPRMALWSRSPDSGQPVRTQAGFPTWSWASVKGTCSYMLASGKLEEHKAEIRIEEETTPATMVVRSWRRRVVRDIQAGTMGDFLFDTENEDNADDSCGLIPDPQDNTRPEGKGWVNDLEVEPYTWYPDCEGPGADAPLHLVEIQRFLVVEKSGIRISWCLVVTPKVGGAGEYQRVGLCHVRYSDPQDYPFTDNEDAREEIRIV